MDALLIVVALVCFVIAALNVLPPYNWLAIGLAFFAAGHIWTRLIVVVQ